MWLRDRVLVCLPCPGPTFSLQLCKGNKKSKNPPLNIDFCEDLKPNNLGLMRGLGSQRRLSQSLMTRVRVLEHTWRWKEGTDYVECPLLYMCSVCVLSVCVYMCKNLALGFSTSLRLLPLLSPTGTDMAVFCLLCGKRFQAQSALQQHMEVHAGVRSYICSECNRTFPSHTALKRHLRSHTGRPVRGWVGSISGPYLWASSPKIYGVYVCGGGCFRFAAFSP